MSYEEEPKSLPEEWEVFRDACWGAYNEDLLKCIRNPAEVEDHFKWPRVIDANRGDIENDFIIGMSDDALQWMLQCKVLAWDNNQSVPWFIKSKRGILIIGLYRGI